MLYLVGDRQASLLIYSMQIPNRLKCGFPSRWQPIMIYACMCMFHDSICHSSMYPYDILEVPYLLVLNFLSDPCTPKI